MNMNMNAHNRMKTAIRLAFPGEEVKLVAEGDEWSVRDCIGRRLIRDRYPKRLFDKLVVKIKHDMIASIEGGS